MSNRNSVDHFSQTPTVDIERSTFDRSVDIKTSFNVGELIPFYVDEVLPGDTFEIQTSKVARLQTLLTPIMDNLYLDTYYFFVPNRLVWEHWKEFCGENTQSAWYPQVEYSVPQLYLPEGGFAVGTIADYMGIPVGVGQLTQGVGINALPFRAYAMICDEWFRDQNLMDPLVIPKNDTAVTGVNTGNYVTDCAKGGKPFIACKYHDYFTSCLPAPQKGPDVSFLTGYAPVVPVKDKYIDAPAVGVPTVFRVNNSTNPINTKNLGTNASGTVVAGTEEFSPSGQGAYIANLWANLDAVSGMSLNGMYNPTSINSLRLAFQIQRLLERDAVSGTRYIEVLKAHFHVNSPDARLQRPEYLGGNRVPLNVEQVINTAGSTTSGTVVTPLGDVAAMSQTNDTNFDVQKSFVEHGFIIGLMVARYDHTYQQGLERMWSRTTRFDYYWPALAHLGNQAVYKSEILYTGQKNTESGVFGYQEAWAEYRYKPNYVTGRMRSDANESLDIWHFADDYSQTPTLSADWIKEDKSNVDRTLAVTSDVSDQIFIDIYVKNKCTRPMPLYSIPGLVDHF